MKHLEPAKREEFDAMLNEPIEGQAVDTSGGEDRDADLFMAALGSQDGG